MSKFTDSWTDEVNGVLNRIRLNSIELSERHRINSFTSKSYRKYFDVPTIILSTMASSFAIGATTFVSQHVVSLTNCGINMFIAMLHSMKLYLNLDETFKNEQASSRAFEYLALELSKTLRLRKEQRNCDGLEYLNKIYSEYIKLKGNSKLLTKMLKKDFLLDIDRKLLRDDDNSYSGNYSPEFITLDDVRDRGLEKKGSTLEKILSPNIRNIFKKQSHAQQNNREQIENDLHAELEYDLESGNAKHVEMTRVQSTSLDMNYVDSDEHNFVINAHLPSNNFNDNNKNIDTHTIYNNNAKNKNKRNGDDGENNNENTNNNEHKNDDNNNDNADNNSIGHKNNDDDDENTNNNEHKNDDVKHKNNDDNNENINNNEHKNDDDNNENNDNNSVDNDTINDVDNNNDNNDINNISILKNKQKTTKK
jgi:hypothetical protein